MTNNERAELERKLKFYEKKMNNPTASKYWRERARVLYNHHLDLLTRPESKHTCNMGEFCTH